MRSAEAEFEARAAARLHRDPPGLHSPRADLRGDHSLNAEGWPIPAGAPKLAGVLVPIVAHDDGPAVLLTQRASNLRQHSGQIAFPGGRMDPDDPTPLATALREAQEEIGLDPNRVRPLGYLDPYLSGTNYLVIPAIGLVQPGFELALNPVEVESAFEVPLDFLMNATNHHLHRREWQGRMRAYHAIPFGERYIWGVTAGILRNMHDRLYGP